MKLLLGLFLVLLIAAPTAEARFFKRIGRAIGRAVKTAHSVVGFAARAVWKAHKAVARGVWNVHKAVARGVWNAHKSVARGLWNGGRAVGRAWIGAHVRAGRAVGRWWKSSHRGMFGHVRGVRQRAAAAARLAAYRLRARRHWRRTWAKVRKARHVRHMRRWARKFRLRLNQRLRAALLRFGRCRTAACRYTCSHALRRIERMRRMTRRMSRCRRLSGFARRRCARRARHSFKLWTRPGRKWHMLRQRRHWHRFSHHMTEFARMETAFGNGVSVNTGMAEQSAELDRMKEDAEREQHACTDDACEKETRDTMSLINTEFESMRAMRKCGHLKTKHSRRRCARRVLRRALRLRPNFLGKPRDERHLPPAERRRRNAERAQLKSLHRRARRCTEHDVRCTLKFHRAALRLVRAIIKRRRHWRLVHKSSLKARRSWGSLRTMIKTLRSRLFKCRGRTSCIRRILRRLTRRTQKAVRHFRRASAKCEGRECRQLCSKYLSALRRFAINLRQRLQRVRARSLARSRARRASRRARRARLLARTRRHSHHSVHVSHHHRRRRHHHRVKNMTARIAAYRKRVARCASKHSRSRRHRCIRKAKASLARFFRRVKRHLRARKLRCNHSKCHAKHSNALLLLKTLARRTLRSSVTGTSTSTSTTSVTVATHKVLVSFQHRCRLARASATASSRHSLRRRYRRVLKVLRRLRARSTSEHERKRVKRARRTVKKLYRRTMAAIGGSSSTSASFSSLSSSSSASWSTYSSVSGATLSSWGFDSHLSTPQLANRLYHKLVARLSSCPAGTSDASKACRRRVLRKFRKVLHAREKALVKLLRWRARAQLGRAIHNCDLTTAGNPTARTTCITTAQTVYTTRLQHLRERALDANKRNALRVCETSADVAACSTQAEKAYVNDLAIAKAEAVTQAAALVAQMQTGTYTVSADPLASLMTLTGTQTPAPLYSSDSFLV